MREQNTSICSIRVCTLAIGSMKFLSRWSGGKKPKQTTNFSMILVRKCFVSGLIIARICSEKNALGCNDAQSIVCMGQAQNGLFLVCTATQLYTVGWFIEKLERHLHIISQYRGSNVVKRQRLDRPRLKTFVSVLMLSEWLSHGDMSTFQCIMQGNGACC